MLEVRKANYFQDGRVVVDSVGVGRFKVNEVTQVDGYESATCDIIARVQISFWRNLKNAFYLE